MIFLYNIYTKKINFTEWEIFRNIFSLNKQSMTNNQGHKCIHTHNIFNFLLIYLDLYCYFFGEFYIHFTGIIHRIIQIIHMLNLFLTYFKEWR